VTKLYRNIKINPTFGRFIFLLLIVGSGRGMCSTNDRFLPCVLEWTLPTYPKIALRARLNDKFVLNLKIDDEAKVSNIELVSSTVNGDKKWGAYEHSVRESIATLKLDPACKGRMFLLKLEYMIVSDSSDSGYPGRVAIKEPDHIVIMGVAPPIYVL